MGRWHDGRWLSGLGQNGRAVKVPLYRLPQIKDESLIVSTEGEKDADAGAQIELPTTTSGGGPARGRTITARLCAAKTW